MFIVQMIDGLAVGGAQKLIVTFAEQASRIQFKVAVVSLSEECNSPYAQQLMDLGIPIHYFPTTRILDLKNLRKVLHFFRSEKPDVLHAHLTYSYIIASFIRLFTGIPVVATLHSTEVAKNRSSRTGLAEIYSLRYGVSTIIACGPIVAKNFTANNKHKPVLVIPNSVDSSPFIISTQERNAIRKNFAGSKNRLIVISVGRLVFLKGFQDLLDAFDLLIKSVPEAFLVIVGDGEFRGELEKKINGLGLSNQVNLLGNRQDVPRLLGASDLYACASHWEGLSISVLEAMAAGLPVISTDVGDTAWAIGSAGLTVPIGQPEIFAESMKKLILNPPRLREMGQNARNIVAEKFNPSIWFDELVSVYRNELN